MLLVPPPTSRFATTARLSSDILSVPAPRADRTDSRSGPAVATTKSPLSAESAESSWLAFFLRAVSPVMMIAPVFTMAGVIPARLYSSVTILFTASASISVDESSGVK